MQNGDIITIDVGKKTMDVQLTDKEMEERKRKWTPPAYKANRGVLYKVLSCIAIHPCQDKRYF